MSDDLELEDEDVEALWLEVPEEKRTQKEIEWIGLDEREIRYRKKMSVLARLRNQEVDPETGRPKFGGAQPGSGRPKKKRVAQVIAEKAQSPEGSRKIVETLWEKLDSGDERVSLRAVESIIRTEAKEEELQQKQQELDDQPKDQLIAGLSEILRRLEKSGELKKLGLKRPDYIDGTAEDVTISEDEGRGEHPGEVQVS